MKKTALFFSIVFLFAATLQAQSGINVTNMATYNAYSGATADSTIPYFKDLGVRRVIVADANNDGSKEIIATDYSNGGRVHVMKHDGKGNLEIIWSSPVSKTSSGSTPRFPQVGDCDGDGKPEIIFEQNNFYGTNYGRIVFYEWNGTSWGTEPAYEITNDMFVAAGAKPPTSGATLRLNREVFTVDDFDRDGRSELITHSYGNSNRDVYILGIDGTFPGFASLVIEGGRPGASQNGIDWATGSQWSSTAADIDGDGKLEIISHHWDRFGMWAIQVNGPNSYRFPDKAKPGAYNRFTTPDALSYFGLAAVDVNGDGISEIAGTMYQSNFDMCLFQFTKADTSTNLFGSDSASVAKRFGRIALKSDMAALGGKTAAEFWPCVKGDLNKDGKDEIYTGGGRGLNLFAVQYKGSGSLLDKNNYTTNLVYKGEGGGVFATYKIYQGRIDTVISFTDTTYVLNPAIIDTVREETPFTSYIFADNVDLDGDGKMEVVLSEQSVYDSTSVIIYKWAPATKSWERDNAASHKIVNTYRKTIRVLEYTGPTGLLQDEGYNIVIPEDYILENNYPNPFNPSTTINFTLPIQKRISLKVFDMLGREVATLIDNELYEKGSSKVVWNGTNNFGAKVASGNYIATLTYGNFSKSIKMTLLK
ncbi:MAG: hypothetical protein CVV24_12005 [Ignavibacteriae bacterium HGW-Ignavibacteriae-3]|nr:MAG: hypothetical protein CVV24_12005 [Ignavibacteriae bacterium HGW-Ignavibacteriae-3]